MVKKKGKAEQSRAKKKVAAASGGRKIVIEQWVEVRIRNGRTVTELTPGNNELRKRTQNMKPQPELVYRRFNFPEGVPSEYDWTLPDENMRRYGGGGVQRMTVDTWLSVSAAEESNGGEHVGPIAKGNLPRPKEHGECECDTCIANARLLKDAA